MEKSVLEMSIRKKAEQHVYKIAYELSNEFRSNQFLRKIMVNNRDDQHLSELIHSNYWQHTGEYAKPTLNMNTLKEQIQWDASVEKMVQEREAEIIADLLKKMEPTINIDEI